MARGAAALKQKGNELFKAGAFSRACQLYAEAEKADDSDPVYPSNLSAALFELGDYRRCIKAILRAWKRMRDTENTAGTLLVRLSTRMAKALSHAAHARTIQVGDLAALQPEIDDLRSAALSTVANDASQDTLRRAWEEWALVESSMSDLLGKRDACLTGLSRLPLFCRPLDDTKEYYGIGHDPVIDLTRGWGGEYPNPLHINKFADDDLANIAFMFGGVGDARHVFGSLCGLSAAYKRLNSQKQKKFRAHLTLLDIHDATIARDLCVFILLHELNNTKDASVRVEMKATLMYMYCSSAMPSYCYTRMQNLFKSVSQRLASNPPDLPPWMHVSQADIPKIRDALNFWMTIKRSTREMLANHTVRPLGMRPPKSATVAAAERARLKPVLLGMSAEQVADAGMCPPGASPQEAREVLHSAIDRLVERLRQEESREQFWTAHTKVLMPPRELWTRHPSFGPAWAELESQDQLTSRLNLSPSSLRQVVNHIESTWKPNIIMFDRSADDPICRRYNRGYRNMMNDHSEVMDELQTYSDTLHAGTRASPKLRGKSGKSLIMPKLAYEVCDAFFEDVAAALRDLEQKVTLEFLIGGLAEELTKMRSGADSSRPKIFPRKFVRMWLSNVPDYTHFLMNIILYVAPNLQDRPYAALACNSLLNTSAWGGSEDLLFHTYTLLTMAELPRYLPCTVLNSQVIMHILELGPTPSLPQPLSSLARRDELTTWLTRVLFNTFIHGRITPSPMMGGDVRLPHNLVAFFGLLMRLHEIGYPGHWLSEFLARVLSGRMVSDIAPYNGVYPIPVRERLRRVPARTVRTDPWLVEFETIVATAYHAIPFPIASALPADFSRDAADVVEWEARVRPTPVALAPATGYHSVPYQPVAHLLFYRSDKVGAEDVIGHMSDVFEGRRAGLVPGMFFVLTAQERVMYREEVRFRMSRRRVERMRGEKWAVVVYRNDVGTIATYPVPIASWVLRVASDKK